MWMNRLATINKNFLFSTSKKYKYTFNHSSYMIPHPSKVYKGGQDAYFVSQNILAVADGVGGWADHGIDPGLYSKKLCTLFNDLYQKNSQKYINDPKQLLIDAVAKNKQVGTTTACIASLCPNSGLLRLYYIGDSVYAILRKDTIQIASDQQKYFNCPYQVGTQGDDPSLGVYHQVEAQKLKQKNVIVLATDGVWDNTHLHQIHQCAYTQSQLSLRAKKLAQISSYNSLKENNSVPFYQKAKKAGFRVQNAGKPDDITVVLATILKKQIL